MVLRGGGGVGLRARLLGLVLVPLALLGALTWSSAARGRERSDAASDVEGRVDDITELVELSSRLLLARTPVEVQVRARALRHDEVDRPVGTGKRGVACRG